MFETVSIETLSLTNQIRSALDKEREAAEQGKVRHQAKLDEMKEKYENVLRQLRNDLEAERNAHHQVHSSLNKVKKVRR